MNRYFYEMLSSIAGLARRGKIAEHVVWDLFRTTGVFDKYTIAVYTQVEETLGIDQVGPESQSLSDQCSILAKTLTSCDACWILRTLIL